MSATHEPVLDAMNPASANNVGMSLATSTQQIAQQLAGSPAVTDVASLELVAEDRRRIGAAIKQVEEFFEPLKRMANQLHKALCAREKAILEPLGALDILKADAIKRFNTEQTKLRAERERKESDERRRQDQERAAAEAAALESQGEPELAAAVIEQAIAAPAPVVALPDTTRAVVSFTRRWYWRYTGGPADVKRTPPDVLARSMKLIPRDYLTPDETKIGRYARAMKESGSIPGVEIYYVDEPNR